MLEAIPLGIKNTSPLMMMFLQAAIGAGGIRLQKEVSVVDARICKMGIR
jgi:hypothetical protein